MSNTENTQGGENLQPNMTDPNPGNAPNTTEYQKDGDKQMSEEEAERTGGGHVSNGEQNRPAGSERGA